VRFTPCGKRHPAPKIDAMNNPSNRRTRLAKDLPPDIRDWLHRVARCHSHLCWLNSLFGERPNRAGGDSLVGATFQERADARDRTLIYDACGAAAEKLLEIRSEIQGVMDSAPPVNHKPGTTAKVATMRQRSDAGLSIFIEADRQLDVA
jgi:hypothetical protein